MFLLSLDLDDWKYWAIQLTPGTAVSGGPNSTRSRRLDQPLVRHRFHGDGLFQEALEQPAAGAGGSAVEPKRQLIELRTIRRLPPLA
jgi:hypothetical protein